MSTEPEQTEISSEAELLDQDLEVVVGGQNIHPFPTVESSDNPEPPTSRTGPYNPVPQPRF